MSILGWSLVGVGLLGILVGIAVVTAGRRSAARAAASWSAVPAAQFGDLAEWGTADGHERDRSGSTAVVGALIAVLGLMLMVAGGTLIALGSDGRAIGPEPEPETVAIHGHDEERDAGKSAATPTDPRDAHSEESTEQQPAETQDETSTSVTDAARPTGDLGLDTPISRPRCDGQGIVVLFSAVTPGAYESEVRAALAEHPGAQYLRTDHACPSLRPRDDHGNVIYAVYRESGFSREALCADVATSPAGAYGRWLDLTSDPNELVQC